MYKMPIFTIYKIQCEDEVYIGSTRDFTQRKNKHKAKCNNEKQRSYNYKIYQAIRASGGWDSKNMIPIEMIECPSSIEARIREEHWRREYGATLNSCQAYTTVEERKNQIHNNKKEWINNNREKRNTYQREYYAKKKASAADHLEELNAQ